MQGILNQANIKPRSIALLPGLAFLQASAAGAASTDCAVHPSALECRLAGVLHWLQAFAVVLGVVLVLVVAIAIHIVRRNRGKDDQ